ncbi:MAG TPA: hypothetical protein ENF75_00070 [Acidilobales archaeon]|nr:hypothetical protein [Acidilobales archaeon]
MAVRIRGFLKPFLIGLFSDGRFSYGRATVVLGSNFSVMVRRIARELRCYEHLDKAFKVHVQGFGELIISGVCVVDSAIIEGLIIDVPAPIHVVNSKEIDGYDIIIGKDLVIHWALTYDPSRDKIVSLLGRPVRIGTT